MAGTASSRALEPAAAPSSVRAASGSDASAILTATGVWHSATAEDDAAASPEGAASGATSEADSTVSAVAAQGGAEAFESPSVNAACSAVDPSMAAHSDRSVASATAELSAGASAATS